MFYVFLGIFGMDMEESSTPKADLSPLISWFSLMFTFYVFLKHVNTFDVMYIERLRARRDSMLFPPVRWHVHCVKASKRLCCINIYHHNCHVHHFFNSSSQFHHLLHRWLTEKAIVFVQSGWTCPTPTKLLNEITQLPVLPCSLIKIATLVCSRCPVRVV